MTKEELSLLLYLESCAVDYAGRVNSKRMNSEDFTIVGSWQTSGFVEFGRITFRDCNRDGDHWIRLSESAWMAARSERRARADRMWKKRSYKTTSEKAAA